MATLILALVAWLYYQTTQFEEVSSMFTQNIPPTLFPRILLVIIALFTLMMPFEHLLLAYKGKDIDKDRREPIKPLAWISMAVLVAIMAAADYLGTQLTMFAVCFVIPILWGERRLRVVVPF
ncbi:MAG: tripartite tricarboxylate transporter TctB family protein, partial [Rhodospirillaceae bacterium]